MRINVVTIFPAFFDEPLRTSIPGRAATAGIAEYRVVDLRDYTHDRHRTVDDEPYGGGAGMVMMVVVLNAVGLPTSAVALILAVDRILDMCRTTVNVRSDSIAAAVVDAKE